MSSHPLPYPSPSILYPCPFHTPPLLPSQTELSLRLADKLNAEIVSADSIQVYRGLDVGSDKLPVAKRRGIPHHLIDVMDVMDDFSAGEFFRLARAAIDDILSRGKTPLVVGGTGFYLHWLINGPPQSGQSSDDLSKKAQGALDAAVAAARAAAGRELEAGEAWEAACGVLEGLGDAASAERMRRSPNNWYRLRRAVEVVQATGRPMAEVALNATADLDYDFRGVFLHRNRIELFRRIDRRCEEMVAGGLLEECAWMMGKGVRAGSHW